MFFDVSFFHFFSAPTLGGGSVDRDRQQMLTRSMATRIYKIQSESMRSLKMGGPKHQNLVQFSDNFRT